MAGDGSVLAVLDAVALRAWARRAALRLRTARDHLDDLNVFPVPDGDTGTNLLLTLDGALASDEPDLARALLVNARGNSGVILSQLARGWADVLTAAPAADAALLAKALRRGDDLGWEAVGEPVEGTVLSVSRAAAGAASAAAEGGADLATTMARVLEAARAALARTTEQLPALARAGVVDAGGAGLLLVLEALAEVVHGEDAGPEPAPDRAAAGVARSAPARPGPATTGHEARYEVMYLLDVPAHAAGDSTDATAVDSTPADSTSADSTPTSTDATAGTTTAAGLRRRLAALGDSVVVAVGGSPWRVHVHTGLPDAAVAAGAEAGHPRDVRVTPLETDGRSDAPGAPRALGVVASVAGQATADLCRQAGAVVVVSEPAARASTGDVLHALLAAGAHADTVVVLPGDPETAAVARQAVLGAAESGVRARVLPSRAQVQVLAALAVLDADDPSSVDAAVAAVAACRHGAVAVATRDALTAAGPCRAGDAVATVADEVVLVRPDLPAAACDLVDLLLADGGELVTLVPGADAGGPDAGRHDADGPDAGGLPEAVRRHLARRSPDVEVAVVGGGHARYALLVGCE